MASPISVTLILDDQQYTGKINAAAKSAEDLGNKTKKAGQEGADGLNKLSTVAGSLKDKMAGLSTLLLGAGFVEMGRRALSLSDSISDLSAGTDVSILRILQLREAFNAAGGNAEGLGKILNSLNVMLYDSQEGSAQAQEALIKLGFSFQDMASLSTDEALQKVINKLAGMEDPVARNALAFKTLGKEAKNIDWAGIRDGTTNTSDEMAKYADAIKKAGAAHDKLQQAQEKLVIAFANLLDKTGVLEFLNGTNTSMARMEKVVIAAGVAFATYFGLAAAANLVTAISGITKAVIALDGAMSAGLLAKLGRFAGVLGLALWSSDLNKGEEEALAKIRKFQDALASLPQSQQEAFFAMNAQNQAKVRALVEGGKKIEEAMAGIGGGQGTMVSQPEAKPVTPAWAKEIQQLDQLSEAYKRGNQDILDRINLETQLVGVSEDQSKKQLALLDLEKNYGKQRADLQSRLAQETAAPQSAAGDARIAQLRTELVEVDALYKADKIRLDSAYDGNIKVNKQLRDANSLYEAQSDHENRLRKITNDMNNLGLGDRQKRYRDIANSARDSAQAQIKEEEKLLGYQRDSATGELVKIKLTQQRKDEIIKLYDDQSTAEQVATLESETNARKFENGWKTAFENYADNANNAADKAKRIFDKFTQGLEDSLVEFFKTGKFGWQNFVSSIVEELLRSQIKQTIASVFTVSPSVSGAGTAATSGSGDVLGSAWSGIKSLFGFANGGMVPNNNPILVGERGPEIISGMGGRTVTPNNALGGTQVTYNINAVDAMSFKAMLARDPSFLYAVSQQGARNLPGRR
jgi:lambda family phage tail tape measure protein